MIYFFVSCEFFFIEICFLLQIITLCSVIVILLAMLAMYSFLWCNCEGTEVCAHTLP